MRVKHLDHLNLSVASLAESIDWYRRVFGFEPMESGTYRGGPWTIVRCGDALLCMYEHADRLHLDGDQLRARRLHGLSHFGLRIDDREAWERTVEREGLHLLYGGASRWKHSTSWYLLDPTGYEIEVALWDDDRVHFDPAAALAEAR
ncbi:MAG: VOC family protein [Planctomycetota bacterium]